MQFQKKYDPQFIKNIFDNTRVVKKPLSGIVSGYHQLPYILIGEQEASAGKCTEIRGKIKVSPKFIISPNASTEPTYDKIFNNDFMDQTLVGRIFSFIYASRLNMKIENENFKINHLDHPPQAQIEATLDEVMQKEVIDTGIILTPNIKFYPVSVERYILEILNREMNI